MIAGTGTFLLRLHMKGSGVNCWRSARRRKVAMEEDADLKEGALSQLQSLFQYTVCHSRACVVLALKEDDSNMQC